MTQTQHQTDPDSDVSNNSINVPIPSVSSPLLEKEASTPAPDILQYGEKIFEEMSRYNIELPEDPMVGGFRELQLLIATCRNHLSRVGIRFREVRRIMTHKEAELARLEAAFQLEKDDLIANDKRVTGLPNFHDRASTAAFILKDRITQINETKADLGALKNIHIVVQHKQSELNGVNDDIKTLIRTMKTELQAGTFYGDESNTSEDIFGRTSSSGVVKGRMQTKRQVSKEERDRVFGGVEDSPIDIEKFFGTDASPPKKVSKSSTITAEDLERMMGT